MSHEGDVFEGKTLDAAVKNGLEALGLSRAEVMITILEEGTSGFLGIGARPYRVRVMRRPGGPPPVESDMESRRRRREGRERRERNGRDRRERRGREFGGAEAVRTAGPERGEERRPDRHEERRGDIRRGARGERRGERGAPGRPPAGGPPEGGRGMGMERREERREDYSEERSGERAGPIERARPEPEVQGQQELGGGGDARRRRRRGRRGGRKRHGLPDEAMVEGGFAPGSAPAEPAAAEAEPVEILVHEQRHPPAETRSDAVQASSLAGDELAAQSRRLTEDLLKAMGFEATVTATVDGNHVEVTAEVAKDEDLLTGRKGEVRQALQHLLNRMLNRGESSRYHLQLEINDFWKRREEELRELAHSLAEEAVSSDGEMVTEYLNAQERRIVHVVLREDSRVKTYALGTGMIKRVAIAPADFEGGPRDESE